MRTYKVSQSNYDLLKGIAFRNANKNYLLDRYGAEDAAADLEENKKAIDSLFDEADKKKIPFWIQNSALSAGENWRKFEECYFNSLLDKAIDLSEVSCL